MGQFNQDNLKEIRNSVKLALKGIEEKYSLNIDLGNIRFTEDTFTCKLTANAKNPSKPKTSPSSTGLRIGDKFKYDGRVFEYIAYNPRSFKYPCLCQNVNTGDKIKFTEAGLKRMVPLTQVK